MKGLSYLANVISHIIFMEELTSKFEEERVFMMLVLLAHPLCKSPKIEVTILDDEDMYVVIVPIVFEYVIITPSIVIAKIFNYY